MSDNNLIFDLIEPLWAIAKELKKNNKINILKSIHDLEKEITNEEIKFIIKKLEALSNE